MCVEEVVWAEGGGGEGQGLHPLSASSPKLQSVNSV